MAADRNAVGLRKSDELIGLLIGDGALFFFGAVPFHVVFNNEDRTVIYLPLFVVVVISGGAGQHWRGDTRTKLKGMAIEFERNDLIA